METVDNRTRNRILLVLFVGVLMGALDIAIVGPGTALDPKNVSAWTIAPSPGCSASTCCST